MNKTRIIIIGVFLVLFTGVSAAEPFQDFKWTEKEPSIDGVHEEYEGIGYAEVGKENPGNMKVYYGYYKRFLYFYMEIGDQTQSDKDYAHFLFNTKDYDSVIRIYRNGQAMYPEKWDEFDLHFYETRELEDGWAVEFMIHEDVIDRNEVMHNSSLFSGTWYPMYLRAVDANNNKIVGRYAEKGYFNISSPYGFRTPRPLYLEVMEPKEIELNKQEDGLKANMSALIIYSQRETTLLNEVALQAKGSGADDECIERVRLHKIDINSKTGDIKREKLLDIFSFPQDNSAIRFIKLNTSIKGRPVSENVVEHEGLQVEYVFSNRSCALEENVPEFYFDITDIVAVGNQTKIEREIREKDMPIESNHVKVTDCVTDEGCAKNQVCDDRFCVNISGECGYAENHEWKKYECCADEECAGKKVCREHECVEESVENDTQKETLGCHGELELDILKQGQKAVAQISGLHNCSSRYVKIMDSPCWEDAEKMCVILLGETNECEFEPLAGKNSYYACMQKKDEIKFAYKSYTAEQETSTTSSSSTTIKPIKESGNDFFTPILAVLLLIAVLVLIYQNQKQ